MAPHYPRAADYITGDTFQVWRCNACGHGRTAPSPADLRPYYPDRYRQYSPAIAAILALLYRRRVRGWASRFAAPGTAFEVGCGNGLMLDILRRMGWRVAGSERVLDSARIARAQFGVPVMVGGLAAVNPASRFDLLLLSQVLEHLDDPEPTIEALAALLKPDGKLIIGVPNFASPQARFGGKGWFHLDVPRHLHHYTPASIAVLLRRYGLDIAGISYASPEHDPYGWIQSALNRIDSSPNRLTRLLMRIDKPDTKNMIHLALGCILGALAVPLSVATWLARRGAVMEVTCTLRPNR
jgi:SAM-dependent methyltransferase